MLAPPVQSRELTTFDKEERKNAIMIAKMSKC
jgi:hypothetical protein